MQICTQEGFAGFKEMKVLGMIIILILDAVSFMEVNNQC